MTAVTIRNPDATYKRTLRSAWPQPVGLLGVWQLHTDEQNAKLNRITGVNATVTGAPTFGADFTTVSQTNYLTTDIAVTPERLTLAVVAKGPASGDHLYLGNRDADGTGGDSLQWLTTTARIRVQAAFNNQQADLLTATPGADAFFVAGAFRNNETTIHLGFGDALEFNAVAGDRSLLPALAFRIGRGVAAAVTTQPADIMLAFIWNRCLSGPQMGEVYRWCQAYAAARGVTTL